jgi:hypothetical protein
MSGPAAANSIIRANPKTAVLRARVAQNTQFTSNWLSSDREKSGVDALLPFNEEKRQT